MFWFWDLCVCCLDFLGSFTDRHILESSSVPSFHLEPTTYWTECPWVRRRNWGRSRQDRRQHPKDFGVQRTAVKVCPVFLSCLTRILSTFWRSLRRRNPLLLRRIPWMLTPVSLLLSLKFLQSHLSSDSEVQNSSTPVHLLPYSCVPGLFLSSPVYFKAVTILSKQQHKTPGSDSTTITKEIPVVSIPKGKKKAGSSNGMSSFISFCIYILLIRFSWSLSSKVPKQTSLLVLGTL